MRIRFLLLFLGFVGILCFDAEAQQQWWRSFQDSRLDTLVSLALTRNGNARAQQARFDATTERIRANEGYYLPNAYLNPLVQQQSLAPNRPLPINAPTGPRLILRTFNLPLDVTYDLNFWQKGNLVAQARNAQSQVGTDIAQTRLDLSVAVAQTYLSLKTNDLRLAILRSNLRLLDSVNRVLAARFRAGLINEVSVTLNKTELQALLVDYENALRAREELIANLSALTATRPLGIPEDTSNTVLPIVTDTLSSAESLVASRPDIQILGLQTDQQRLLSQQLSYNRLPRPFLLASTGFTSRAAETLIQQNSFTYLVGGGISIPIWDYRNNRYFVKAARREIDWRKALLDQQRIQAQSELQAAIVNLRRTRRQLEQNRQAIVTAQRAITLTGALYSKGLIQYLDLLNAERNIITLQNQQVQLTGQYWQYVVNYWQARGAS
jgi:outer membrane protein TolC